MVETADDGREALERARATPPDAIVADWLMPGLDGITLVRASARADRELAPPPASWSSPAGAEPEYARLAVDAGADLVLRQAARPRGPSPRPSSPAPAAAGAAPPRSADSRTDPLTGPAQRARAARGHGAHAGRGARHGRCPICLAGCDTDGPRAGRPERRSSARIGLVARPGRRDLPRSTTTRPAARRAGARLRRARPAGRRPSWLRRPRRARCCAPAPRSRRAAPSSDLRRIAAAALAVRPAA